MKTKIKTFKVDWDRIKDMMDGRPLCPKCDTGYGCHPETCNCSCHPW